MKRVFDCDLHQTYRHQSELYPFIEEPYLSRMKERGLGYPASPYSSSVGYKRLDATPPLGTAGGDRDFMSRQLFEEMGISRGVLNGHGIFSVSYMPEKDYPLALAYAYNRWLIHEWLEKDDRYYGSLHIALQNPVGTAAMIRDLGQHNKILQVIVPSQTPFPIAHEFYKPIIEAVTDTDLVLAFHPWQPAITTAAATPIGNPMSYLEWRVLAGMPSQAQLVNLIVSGVLEEYKGLKTFFIEGGVSWLPFYLWRIDQLYKSFRQDVPWLKKLPSEYIIEKCRFGIQPMEEPPEREYYHQIIEMISGKDTLVYSSDYPHWDADNPSFTAKYIPAEYHDNIFFNNAMKLYNL